MTWRVGKNVLLCKSNYANHNSCFPVIIDFSTIYEKKTETRSFDSNVKCFYRFEEECTEIEEENCQTVYDDAWENKCQSVNVTLPSSTCREVTRTVMELKCVRCFTKNCLVIVFITLELTIWFTSSNWKLGLCTLISHFCVRQTSNFDFLFSTCRQKHRLIVL